MFSELPGGSDVHVALEVHQSYGIGIVKVLKIQPYPRDPGKPVSSQTKWIIRFHFECDFLQIQARNYDKISKSGLS